MKNRMLLDYLILTESQEGEASLVNCNSQNFVEINDGKMIETGIVLQTCGLMNRNGRIYTENTVRSMYSGTNVKIRLQMGKLFGELDHPIPEGNPKKDMRRMARIDQGRTCHLLKDIDYSLNNAGKLVYGKFRTLTNDAGKLIRDNIKYNDTQYSVSSRTLMTSKGIKKQNGAIVIDDPRAMYITHDLVDIPSDRNAHITANDHVGLSKGKVQVAENKFELRIEDSEVGLSESDFRDIIKGTSTSNGDQLAYFVESLDMIEDMSPANITKGVIALESDGRASIGIEESSGIIMVKEKQLDRIGRRMLNYML